MYSPIHENGLVILISSYTNAHSFSDSLCQPLSPHPRARTDIDGKKARTDRQEQEHSQMQGRESDNKSLSLFVGCAGSLLLRETVCVCELVNCCKKSYQENLQRSGPGKCCERLARILQQ